MKKKILFVILIVARTLGLFAVARRFTSGDLRILCYHGAAICDENEFRPGLFISAEKFASRMQFLKDNGYPVLPLETAVQMLGRNELTNCSTVITIDDGWLGTHSIMAPILDSHGYPATLYIATYYLEKQTQVFNVATAYVAWASGASSIDLAEVDSGLNGVYRLDDPDELGTALDSLSQFANSLDGADQRQDLLRRYCNVLEFDWKHLETRRLISFMNAQEAADLPRRGIDLQLHTHRHRFPDTSADEILREIDDNKKSIGRITNSEPSHFCYPSGFYVPWQLEHLDAAGIETAVTTKPGYNRSDTPRLELNRFLDSDIITQLEFEAEMTGFFELIRRVGFRI